MKQYLLLKIMLNLHVHKNVTKTDFEFFCSYCIIYKSDKSNTTVSDHHNHLIFGGQLEIIVNKFLYIS